MKITNDKYSKPTWAFALGGIVVVLGIFVAILASVVGISGVQKILLSSKAMDQVDIASGSCSINAKNEFDSCVNDCPSQSCKSYCQQIYNIDILNCNKSSVPASCWMQNMDGKSCSKSTSGCNSKFAYSSESLCKAAFRSEGKQDQADKDNEDNAADKNGGGNGGGNAIAATTAGCSPNSPAKVWSCYKDTGNCSGCLAYGNGGAYPKKSSNNSCFDNCFKNIKPGNGSYCKTYCAQGSTCFDNCFKNIKPGNGSYCRNYCANLNTPTPTPSPTPAESQVNQCWGNSTGLGGKCYDCNGDQFINILDFACFARNWMATIN